MLHGKRRPLTSILCTTVTTIDARFLFSEVRSMKPVLTHYTARFYLERANNGVLRKPLS